MCRLPDEIYTDEPGDIRERFKDVGISSLFINPLINRVPGYHFFFKLWGQSGYNSGTNMLIQPTRKTVSCMVFLGAIRRVKHFFSPFSPVFLTTALE
jgi:hypothetical protein